MTGTPASVPGDTPVVQHNAGVVTIARDAVRRVNPDFLAMLLGLLVLNGLIVHALGTIAAASHAQQMLLINTCVQSRPSPVGGAL